MAQITNKDQYYKLWKALRLGNRIRVFENYMEFLNSNYNGPTSIRYKQPGSRFKAFYIPAVDVPDKVKEFVSQGASRDLLTFNESAPDDKLLIQGELQYLVGGLNLSYDTRPVSMKEAMLHPKHVNGVRVGMMLRHYMCPKSYDMIQELLEQYPDSAIEFGVYGCNLGIIPGHNTVVWEIRDY